MLVAGLLVVIVIIVVAIILTNNSGSSHSGSVAQIPASTGQATGTGSASTPATGATSSTGTGTATTPAGTAGATGATGVHVLGQMKLTSPTGTTSPAGAAEIVTQNGKEGIVLLAQGVAPNTKHNSYAVWLYSGPGKAYRLGFVNPAVGASGKIQTATVLPPNAAGYKYVLVTLETTSNTKVPGHVVLKGPLVLG